VVVQVWFKHDLRLTDHPGLLAAVAAGAPIIPCFSLCPSLYSPLALTPGGPAGALVWTWQGGLSSSSRGWVLQERQRDFHNCLPRHCCSLVQSRQSEALFQLVPAFNVETAGLTTFQA
jgi:hypothetical protein